MLVLTPRKSFFTVCLVVQLSACSIYSLPGQTPVPIESDPGYTEVKPPISAPASRSGSRPESVPGSASQPSPAAEPSVAAAYQPLLDRAEAATARGDYEEALALLERAQRVDPDNADVYLGMARTHDARGDSAQASATAERGLLYCRSDYQCGVLRNYLR